jgi:hypothetical protein
MLIDRRLVPKIPLHQQLADLGVQLLDLCLAGGLGRLIATVKQAGHAVHRLPLPSADHRMVHAMLGGQLRQRQIAPDCLHRNLGLEFCTVALSRHLHSSPFSGQAELITLPRKTAPPQTTGTGGRIMIATYPLPIYVQRFFTERLLTQMQASPNTIASYRDTFRLLLKYATAETRLPPTELHVAHIDADIIGRFLTFCEDERGNSARSRNTRLGSPRVFQCRLSKLSGNRFRCLVPGFDGALFGQEWKDALWARYCTAAPARQRQSVEQYKIVKRA